MSTRIHIKMNVSFSFGKYNDCKLIKNLGFTVSTFYSPENVWLSEKAS